MARNYSKAPVITETQEADVEVVGPPTHSITSPLYVGQNPPYPRPEQDIRDLTDPTDALGILPTRRKGK
jgi:hypothetical protein